MSRSYLSGAIWLSMMSATFIPGSHNFNKSRENIKGRGGWERKLTPALGNLDASVFG
jgi:hypothetical protein